MSGPEMVMAIASLVSAGTGVASLANKPKAPKGAQAGKTPDAGLSDKDRRNKLLAQLAAGAARNNPSGGLAGNPNTGSVTLGS